MPPRTPNGITRLVRCHEPFEEDALYDDATLMESIEDLDLALRTTKAAPNPSPPSSFRLTLPLEGNRF